VHTVEPDVSHLTSTFYLAASSLVARILTGFMLDFNVVDKVMLQKLAILIESFGFMSLPFIKGAAFFKFMCVLLGVADGVILAVIVPIMIDFIGVYNAAHGLASIFAMLALPLVAGPDIAGR